MVAFAISVGTAVAVADHPQLVAGSLHDYLAYFAKPLWSFVGTRFDPELDWVLVVAVLPVVAVIAVEPFVVG